MSETQWVDVGSVEELSGGAPCRPLKAGRTALAITFKDGVFSAISGTCNHAGGPLGEGRLDGDYLVCPWHNWKYHCRSGEGEPGFESDRVPAYDTKIEEGRLLVNLEARTPRHKTAHAKHHLARPVTREPGPIRVVGLSTTAMDAHNPRYSTSDALLSHGLAHATDALGAQTRLIRLNELRFRHCEGYYSKSARACTWPCSITQMDASDEMEAVYEALVHYADVVLLATPIRWGGASSLYYKMIERLNCVQNQMTIGNRVLIRNKVASFIITGGQDNIQGVAGQVLGFFGELGFLFPQFPYVAHSRGWTAEDMERNVTSVQQSESLRSGTAALVARAVTLAKHFVDEAPTPERIERGGRKAHRLHVIDD